MISRVWNCIKNIWYNKNIEKIAPIVKLLDVLSKDFQPTSADDISKLVENLVENHTLSKARRSDGLVLFTILEMTNYLTRDNDGKYLLSVPLESVALLGLREAFIEGYRKIVLRLGASSFMVEALQRYLTQAINAKAYVEQKEVDVYDFYTYITAKTNERVNDADFKKYVLLPLILLGYFFLEDKSKTQLASETLYLSYFKTPFLSKYRPHLYKYILKNGV